MNSCSTKKKDQSDPHPCRDDSDVVVSIHFQIVAASEYFLIKVLTYVCLYYHKNEFAVEIISMIAKLTEPLFLAVTGLEVHGSYSIF